MSSQIRPLRSVLYIPGSRPRALEKAQSLATDAIIFDLEDAVAPDEKAAAREGLAEALVSHDFGARFRIVRVNGAETEWGAEDISRFIDSPADALLLPKVNNADQISDIASKIPDGSGLEIWAMMETPEGVLNAQNIARAPRMGGFVMGTNDLAKDLGSQGRAAMHTALQHCLLAARAAGIACIDGVYNAFKDEDGLRAECLEGRDFGFDGKTLIHPAQLAIANEVFAPSSDDLELARRQIEAFEQAALAGQGVAVVDGRIVENLHVATARKLLAQADAIAMLDGHAA